MVRKMAEEQAATVWPIAEEKLKRKLAVPSQGRPYYIRYALKMGWTVERIFGLTKIDPWFLTQMKELVDFEEGDNGSSNAFLTDCVSEMALLRSFYDDAYHAMVCVQKEKFKFWSVLRKAKEYGYSDVQLSRVLGYTRAMRSSPQDSKTTEDVKPVYKLVDTCAAEFEAATPYYYSPTI